MEQHDDYGIVGNVTEPDRAFRMGAKAWIANMAPGQGWDRVEWIAMSRGGRMIRKWAPLMRFSAFRAKWIPPNREEDIWGWNYCRGTREKMESLAQELNVIADDERQRHPNRRGNGASD